MSVWGDLIDAIDRALFGFSVQVSPFIERGKPVWIKAQRVMVMHRADAIRLYHPQGWEGDLAAAQKYVEYRIGEAADAAVSRLENMAARLALRDQWRDHLQFCPAVNGQVRRFHDFIHWPTADVYDCVHCDLRVTSQTLRHSGAVLS